MAGSKLFKLRRDLYQKVYEGVVTASEAAKKIIEKQSFFAIALERRLNVRREAKNFTRRKVRRVNVLSENLNILNLLLESQQTCDYTKLISCAVFSPQARICSNT